MSFVCKENEYLFNVFSDLGQIDYYIYVPVPDDLDKAMEIAEMQMTKWFEDDEGFGYVEIVTNELKANKIAYKVYVELED